MTKGRFSSFVIREQESDLWIGISPEIDPGRVEIEVSNKLHDTRRKLTSYIKKFPEFSGSLLPVRIQEDDEVLIRKMKECSQIAGTGPMSTVAGLIAEEIGTFILQNFSPREIIVENGGDIFLSVVSNLVLSIDAGNNKAFNSLGILIPGNAGPLGVCTSSGMFGHSFSQGKADAVCVCCKSAALADAWATGIANCIRDRKDIDRAMGLFNQTMLSLVCIKDSWIGVKGGFLLTRLEQ